jgi:diadenosine tetraphosphate (Ap4A) HIT family hydrolase
MDDCIFCKIINGAIPGFKVWEDANFLAFFDINPNVKGTTLVVPKAHVSSNWTDADNTVLAQAICAAKQVSAVLRKYFKVERVGLAIDGTGVDHLHLKLYPMHKGARPNLNEGAQRVFYESYPGFVSSQLGPQADFTELKKMAEELAAEK